MSALHPQQTIGVIGAGAMGSGIAQVALNAGHPVVLHDAAPAALAHALASIRASYGRLLEKGRISRQQHDERLARLHGGTLQDLAPAALVIEAIVERLDVKIEVLSQVESLLQPGAIIASNTSSLSITAIAAGLQRPQQVVGMHFFNPAPVLPLVEVVRGKASDRQALETVFDTARAWNKIPVHCSSTPGFIVNRIARPFYGEALRLLAEGAADVATLDKVLRQAGGFRMGAFELMDLIGHDINYAVTRSVYDALYQDPRYKPSLLQKELVDAGWLGRKSGRGFYHHDAVAPTTPAVATPADHLPPPPQVRDVAAEGELGVAAALIDLAHHAGLAVRVTDGAGVLHVDGVTLALTDGRSATERHAADGVQVLFDLALDYRSAGAIAVARADQAPPASLQTAIAFFRRLGKQVVVLDDCPGLVVMRTVAMLANEGADAVQQGIAVAADVDLAMVNGVNYPLGPLAWADRVGIAHIGRVIRHLGQGYGEDRYRVSPLLARMALSNRTFFTGERHP
ncbi:3-hydroxyacyl-CoA dehydrogenase [Herbaspirillum sp. YR522]|uniref:3-hydroxyacyl-CoA dehydrogenase n=1 Tax=Herbaspirillum sp. YR522 TaxID=1144342 RepID=UPI00026F7614|nr:3-hydroxyacyl-CoA dehydrogenase [Herbaspirillum sp. YR522]EJN09993.1 3-hydroxyacyl-CoA dehydrogenase [Herbaspirillum sp. YR522]